jgi:hypothetical protein
MFDDSSFQRFVSSMNTHLPAQKRSLAELLVDKDPSYLGKDGHRYYIERAELEYLASLVPSEDRTKVRLPILVMTDTGGESGAWKVTGKVEAKLVGKVLGRDLDSEDLVLFYYPHLNELRKKLPTTTSVMFLP